MFNNLISRLLLNISERIRRSMATRNGNRATASALMTGQELVDRHSKHTAINHIQHTSSLYVEQHIVMNGSTTRFYNSHVL